MQLNLRSILAANREFYCAPVDLDGRPPGGLLRAEPVVARLLPGLSLRARAWRVLYRSTSAVGEPIAVSGTVLVPNRPYDGPRPLVGYAVGTQGMAPWTAPSLQLLGGIEYEAAAIVPLLRRGWAIAMTDYPGLGTPGRHPFAVGRALGPAVLDAIRAARALPDAGLDGGPVMLYGYSEGGTAAGWAAQLQPTYAPDIPLIASVVGAPAADLEYCAHFLTGSRFAWLHAYAAVGLDSAYPELGLDDRLNDRGRRMAVRVADSHIVSQVLTRFPRKFDRAQYVLEDLFADPSWLARIRENRMGGIAPASPVLLTHATADQAIGYGQAPVLRDDWTRLGVAVTFRSYRGLEHLTGGIATNRTALPWLTSRLAERGVRRVAA